MGQQLQGQGGIRGASAFARRGRVFTALVFTALVFTALVFTALVLTALGGDFAQRPVGIDHAAVHLGGHHAPRQAFADPAGDLHRSGVAGMLVDRAVGQLHLDGTQRYRRGGLRRSGL
jgi:hypothetical protein